jgi:hypothetical protein
MKILRIKNTIKVTAICLLLGIASFSFAQQKALVLTLDTTKKAELKISNNNGEYQIQTLGKDPYIYTLPLTSERRKENVALSFEYFCPNGLDFFR